MFIDFPFRQWLPDLPDLNNPGLVEAKNVYRRNGAYHPINAVSFPGGARSVDLGVSATSNGVVSSMSAAESGVEFYTFAVTNGSSVTLLANQQGVATVNSTSVATNSGAHCNFVNYDGDVYFFARDSKQYKSVRGGAFTQVSTATMFNPAAAAKVGRFIMTGFRFGLKWSAFNDPEDWAISQRTRAGEATVNNPELGFITGITGGRVNFLFQEYGVSRVEFVGSPSVWRFTVVSNRVGAVQGSPIEVAGVTYFLGSSSADGDSLGGSGRLSVYKTNGSQVAEVEGVSDWLNDNFSTGTNFLNVRNAVFDRDRDLIIWASGTGAATHKFLCMNVKTEEFSYFEAAHRAIVPGPFHTGQNAGEIVVVAENSGNLHYAPLAGDALEATLTTGHIASPGERVMVCGAEAHYSGSGATFAVSGKDRYGASSDFGTYKAADSLTGKASVRADGRAAALSIKIPSGETWGDLTGATIETDARGKR